MSEKQGAADVLRRETRRANRLLRFALSNERARAVIGELGPGSEIVCISRGDVSLLNVISECVRQSGPADVSIAVWTVGRPETMILRRMVESGAIRSLRLVFDQSLPARDPTYLQMVRGAFPDECLRMARMHAKFALVRNERWDLAIRTSMNLNENTRLEIFEVSEDRALCDYFDRLVAEVFELGTATMPAPLDDLFVEKGMRGYDQNAKGIGSQGAAWDQSMAVAR